MDMKRRATRNFICAVIVAAVVYIMFGARFNLQRLGSSPVEYKLPFPMISVDPRSISDITDTINCTVARVDRMRFPICTYPPNEDSISRQVAAEGKYWKLFPVRLCVDLMKGIGNNSAQKPIFVDIGANIGSYSLPVAHAGFQVISVEPNWQTMRLLATSVVRGNIIDRVTLLQNAVSNEHSTLNLAAGAGNHGSSYLLPATHNCTQNPTLCQQVVKTITLDDLLQLAILKSQDDKTRVKVVIKVAAQGSEINIFDPATSARFFRHVDVVVMQIEWALVGQHHFATTDVRVNVDKVLNFFYDMGYSVHQLTKPSSAPLSKDWGRWPYDVLLRKR